MYNVVMAMKATKLEDIGNERDQKVFMTMVKLWFNGNFQIALDERNKMLAERDALVLQRGITESPLGNIIEVKFRLPHQ